MPLERNPLDKLADELADWADVVSTQIADSLMGGFAAPGAARLSEQQKLEYYSRQLFNPDGSPNMAGRTQEMERLGPTMFAEVFAEVGQAHPEWVRQQDEQPFVPGYRQPTDVPGVTEISDQPEMVRPTTVPGVSQVLSGPEPLTRPTHVPGVREVVGSGVPMRAMAQGGIVTEPTLALIGEAGPEAVVPLTPGAPTVPQTQWRPPDPVIDPRDSRYYPQAVNTAVPVPGQPKPGEIEAYIRQAAAARGIDPDVAVRVAYHEGGIDPRKGPDQVPFSDPAVEARFSTGRSWWPFQLHYGGPEYRQWDPTGQNAGIGNEFTKATGWQPGDPRAWQAATDYALDEVLRTGWQKWYGRQPANVGVWQGVPTTGRA